MIFPVLLVKVVQTKPQTVKQISLCTANMLDQQYYNKRRLYCRCTFFYILFISEEDGPGGEQWKSAWWGIIKKRGKRESISRHCEFPFLICKIIWYAQEPFISMMAVLTTVLEWLKRISKLASRAWEYSGTHTMPLHTCTVVNIYRPGLWRTNMACSRSQYLHTHTPHWTQQCCSIYLKNTQLFVLGRYGINISFTIAKTFTDVMWFWMLNDLISCSLLQWIRQRYFRLNQSSLYVFYFFTNHMYVLNIIY